MNSTTKIIAGVAVLALLFAGIGFALDYEGKVTSSDNKITYSYISLDEGYDAATMKVIGNDSTMSFKTETAIPEGGEAAVVTYTFNDSNIKTGKILVKCQGIAAGKDIALTMKQTTGEFTLAGDKFTVTAEAEGQTITVDYDATDGWVFTGLKSVENGNIVIDVTFAIIAESTFTQPQFDALATGFDFLITATATIE